MNTDNATARIRDNASLIRDRDLGPLVSKTIVTAKSNDLDTLTLAFDDGMEVEFTYERSCCEHVEIEDIAGDLQDLVGSPLTMAEMVSESEPPPGWTEKNKDRFYDDNTEWTYVKLATVKGYVTVRWYGQDNGCYGTAPWVKVHCPEEDELKDGEA